MEIFPTIYQSIFGKNDDRQFSKRYAVVNSIAMREFLNQLNVGKAWRVKISDYYESDSDPHYVLEFGMNSDKIPKRAPHEEIEVDYCDNWSNPDKKTIEQSTGRFIVLVAGEFDNIPPRRVALAVAHIYVKVLERAFPEHFLYIDEKALRP